MHVLDHVAERKSNNAYIEDKNAARDYFMKQKSAIDAISQTQWFLEIRNYWAREVEAGIQRLRTTKKDWADLWPVQAEVNLAIRFLDFLENFLQPIPSLPDDEK